MAGKGGRPSMHSAGERFGMLVLKQKVRTKPNSSGGQKWLIQCDCGKRFTAPIFYMVREQHPKRHCGCKAREGVNPYPREKGIWQMMHRRCYYSDHKFYKYYGGATPPIGVESRWHRDNPDGWKNFIADMGPAPTKKYTLDRENPFKWYGPNNCRWATPKEQGNNMKRHWIERGYKPEDFQELAKEEETASDDQG